jgi:hypothetical protein
MHRRSVPTSLTGGRKGDSASPRKPACERAGEGAPADGALRCVLTALSDLARECVELATAPRAPPAFESALASAVDRHEDALLASAAGSLHPAAAAAASHAYANSAAAIVALAIKANDCAYASAIDTLRAKATARAVDGVRATLAAVAANAEVRCAALLASPPSTLASTSVAAHFADILAQAEEAHRRAIVRAAVMRAFESCKAEQVALFARPVAGLPQLDGDDALSRLVDDVIRAASLTARDVSAPVLAAVRAAEIGVLQARMDAAGTPAGASPARTRPAGSASAAPEESGAAGSTRRRSRPPAATTLPQDTSAGGPTGDVESADECAADTAPPGGDEKGRSPTSLEARACAREQSVRSPGRRRSRSARAAHALPRRDSHAGSSSAAGVSPVVPARAPHSGDALLAELRTCPHCDSATRRLHEAEAAGVAREEAYAAAKAVATATAAAAVAQRDAALLEAAELRSHQAGAGREIHALTLRLTAAQAAERRAVDQLARVQSALIDAQAVAATVAGLRSEVAELRAQCAGLGAHSQDEAKRVAAAAEVRTRGMGGLACAHQYVRRPASMILSLRPTAGSAVRANSPSTEICHGRTPQRLRRSIPPGHPPVTSIILRVRPAPRGTPQSGSSVHSLTRAVNASMALWYADRAASKSLRANVRRVAVLLTHFHGLPASPIAGMSHSTPPATTT